MATIQVADAVGHKTQTMLKVAALASVEATVPGSLRALTNSPTMAEATVIIRGYQNSGVRTALGWAAVILRERSSLLKFF